MCCPNGIYRLQRFVLQTPDPILKTVHCRGLYHLWLSRFSHILIYAQPHLLTNDTPNPAAVEAG